MSLASRLQLQLITADPAIARHAVDCGVGRIFVDLESRGKAERQAGRGMVLNAHTVAQATAVRAAIPGHELMLRINPPWLESAGEITAAIAAGADLVMLPMVRDAEEVAAFVAAIAGRTRAVVLVETPAALVRLDAICAVPGVDEIYLGLNDLRLGLGLDFLFEPLAGGLVDLVAATAARHGKPWGFGGLARRGAGTLPMEAVLAEHVRLGSQRVILSRAFHGEAPDLAALRARLDLADEIAAIRWLETALAQRTPATVEADRQRTVTLIQTLAAQARRSATAP